MANVNSTGVSSRADHLSSVKPADIGGHKTPTPARPISPAQLRAETELAYLLRDRQAGDAARREIAEYAA